ncbi:MAG: nucleotidyltransferase domain-containing protein [Candidatus Terrybacteria bacterium]|nr:nucleotidyltransferase domain-containing protein [Candidatus Terrybacteria bacterium]
MVKKIIPSKINKIVKGYTQRLSEKENIPIKKVIIFGSQIKGKSHRWSDIDVCIISPRFSAPLDALYFLFKKRNQEEVMAGLEPIGFSEKDFKSGGSLIREIQKTGIELKV